MVSCGTSIGSKAVNFIESVGQHIVTGMNLGSLDVRFGFKTTSVIELVDLQNRSGTNLGSRGVLSGAQTVNCTGWTIQHIEAGT